jgi:HYDIN/CFA65/VesB family protein
MNRFEAASAARANPTNGTHSMKIAILAATLAAASNIVAAAQIGRSASASTPTGSGLVTYPDVAAFLAATNGIALNFENFSAHDSFNVSPCYEPLNRDSGQPGTSFLEPVCFRPGEVIGGFDIRSDLDWTSGITNPWGPMTGPGLFFIGSNAVSPGPASNAVGATFSAATKTLINFRDGPVAVSMDGYDIAAGSPLTFDVYADKGVPIGSFTVPQTAPNVPAFAGFTSPVPVAQVVVHSASAVSQIIGNLRFGGFAGRLAASTDRLDLGAVGIGATASQSLQIENAGNTDVAIDPIAALPAPFVMQSDDCSAAVLAAGESCAVTIEFAPAIERSFSAVLEVSSSDADVPVRQIDLRGRGVLPTLTATPLSIDFGTVPIGGSAGPITITLRNTTAVALGVGAIGMPGAPFVADGGTCAQAPFVLAPGQSCALAFSFEPQQDGVYRDRVVIQSDDPSSPGEVMLRGAAGDVIFADGFEDSP